MYYVDKGFECIVVGCLVLIVIVGGKKLFECEVLEMCYQVIDQGVFGVDMGCNIFQLEDLVVMIKVVYVVVYYNEIVECVYELFLSEKG